LASPPPSASIFAVDLWLKSRSESRDVGCVRDLLVVGWQGVVLVVAATEFLDDGLELGSEVCEGRCRWRLVSQPCDVNHDGLRRYQYSYQGGSIISIIDFVCFSATSVSGSVESIDFPLIDAPGFQ
jgi:hypothetical protein